MTEVAEHRAARPVAVVASARVPELPVNDDPGAGGHHDRHLPRLRLLSFFARWFAPPLVASGNHVEGARLLGDVLEVDSDVGAYTRVGREAAVHFDVPRPLRPFVRRRFGPVVGKDLDVLADAASQRVDQVRLRHRLDEAPVLA